MNKNYASFSLTEMRHDYFLCWCWVLVLVCSERCCSVSQTGPLFVLFFEPNKLEQYGLHFLWQPALVSVHFKENKYIVFALNFHFCFCSSQLCLIYVYWEGWPSQNPQLFLFVTHKSEQLLCLQWMFSILYINRVTYRFLKQNKLILKLRNLLWMETFDSCGHSSSSDFSTDACCHIGNCRM